MFFLADLGVRVCLAFVFALAAFEKARSVDAWRPFVTSIRALALVPSRIPIELIGATVIVCEAACAVALLIPATVSVGVALALGLVVAFTAVGSYVVSTGRDVECRCFGSRGSRFSWWHVARNALLVGLAALGAIVHFATHNPHVSAEGVFIAVAGGCVLGFVVTRWDDLVYLAMSDPRGLNAREVDAAWPF